MVLRNIRNVGRLFVFPNQIELQNINDLRVRTRIEPVLAWAQL